MAFRIPINLDSPDTWYTSRLDGVDYRLRIRYNTRADRYFLDVADALGVAIVQNVKLTAFFPLLDTVTDARKPLGGLIVVPLDGDLGPITRERTWRLHYFDAEELGRG